MPRPLLKVTILVVVTYRSLVEANGSQLQQKQGKEKVSSTDDQKESNVVWVSTPALG